MCDGSTMRARGGTLKGNMASHVERLNAHDAQAFADSSTSDPQRGQQALRTNRVREDSVGCFVLREKNTFAESRGYIQDPNIH